ncbi:Arc family DNA-binding protein [Agrobacterium cavarae]|nr:Arc family DNA-binding protein [Agrobacterium cavarae]
MAKSTITNDPVRDQDKFMLRLPEGMREQIKASANRNNRSMNAEIVQ